MSCTCSVPGSTAPWQGLADTRQMGRTCLTSSDRWMQWRAVAGYQWLSRWCKGCGRKLIGHGDSADADAPPATKSAVSHTQTHLEIVAHRPQVVGRRRHICYIVASRRIWSEWLCAWLVLSLWRRCTQEQGRRTGRDIPRCLSSLDREDVTLKS